ncbi:MAG: 16S rRNA (cytosine(1402)-N(4))-methyltransferase RsmH [Eubacteriales bacterium]|nr:16S rRNA (cytosine(1402)-N(4))-methyltransferase RsmH [Eubacteriales bacterium]
MVKHYSVLLDESIEGLNIFENGIYVDCTLGYGGHSSEILKRIKRGFIFAFDQDIDAINYSTKRLSEIGNNFEIINSNFKNLRENLLKRNIKGVDGILFDLGVSSPQLDCTERGFSYHNDARLDMRMDKSNEISAYEIVNNYSFEELTNIFFKYGEEQYSRSIAKNIVKKRTEKPIETTLELVDIIKASVPEKRKRETHPAKKVFQAIRIEVNKELEVFEQALIDAIDMLNPGGRICVITFHSLEDRICKSIFKKYSKIDDKVKGLPIIPDEFKPKIKLINNKPITASNNELDENNRSRSAKLRIIEKL